MEVTNSRRILAVSLDSSAHHLSRVIQDLTGSSPQPVADSLAGTSHHLRLETPYYTATVPLWLDLIAAPPDWAESFLSDEARQVLAVLGGLVVVFAIPSATPDTLTGDDHVPSLIRHVGRVVHEGLGGWEWDGVRLAVGVGDAAADEWDELCAEAGLEFIQVGREIRDTNEFGEKTGIPRLREALESNDWALDDEQDQDSEYGDFQDPADAGSDAGNLDFGVDQAGVEGLRAAIWESHRDDDEKPVADPAGDSVDDEDVAKVEAMMRKLQAARDVGQGMSEAQRKRLAAKAVGEVMREL